MEMDQQVTRQLLNPGDLVTAYGGVTSTNNACHRKSTRPRRHRTPASSPLALAVVPLVQEDSPFLCHLIIPRGYLPGLPPGFPRTLLPSLHPCPTSSLSLSRPSFDSFLGPSDIPLSMPHEMICYVMNSNTNLYRPDRLFCSGPTSPR